MVSTEVSDRVQAILAEGVRRYGEPEISERGVVNWSAGRTLFARASDERGLDRIVNGEHWAGIRQLLCRAYVH